MRLYPVRREDAPASASSQEGLAIPERYKLQMKIESRGAVSFSWSQAKQIAGEVYNLDIDDVLKERYTTLFILALRGVVRFENQ